MLVPGVDGSLGASNDPFYYNDASVSYVLHTSNLGDTDGPGPIKIKVELSPGVALVSAAPASWSCAPVAPSLSMCTHAGPLPAGGDLDDLELTLSVGPQEIVRDNIKVCSELVVDGDVNPNNNGVCEPYPVHLPTAAYDLKIVKTIWNPIGSVMPNGAYRIDVTNLGPDPVSDLITVSDTIPSPLWLTGIGGAPAPWTCVNLAGDPVECTLPGLGVNQTKTLIFVVDVDPSWSGVVENCATVFAPQDTNPANDESCVTATVNGPPPFDLTSAGQLWFPPSPGTTGSYKWTLHNDGPNMSSGPVTMDIDLPDGTSFGGWSSPTFGLDCTYDPATPDTLACHMPAMDVGDSEQLAIWFHVPGASSTDLEACLTVDALGDSNAANNTSCVTTGGPPLSPPTYAVGTSISLPEGALVGDVGVLTALVSNTGEGHAPSPVFHTFSLPASIRFVGLVSGSGWACVATTRAEGGEDVTCSRALGVPAQSRLDPLELAVHFGAPGELEVCGMLTPADDLVKDQSYCVTAVVRSPR